MQPLAQPPATKDSGLTRWLFLAWKKLLDSFNSDNFSGTEWEDLTDGGDTALHTHSTKEDVGVAASLDAAHLLASDPHPQYLTPAEGDLAYSALGHDHAGVYDPAGTAAAAVSAHEGAADPHPVYLTGIEGAAAYEPKNANIQSHIASTANPHGVTAAQVGAYTSGQTDTLLAGKSDTSHSHAGVYQPLDADLTTIAGLADPNADRILFWDDSAGAYAYLTPSTGLVVSTTSMTVRTTSEAQTGIVELATAAETQTGTDTTRAVHPAGFKTAGNALWDAIGAASSAVASHVGGADPHTQYVLETEKAAANGVATLDAGGLIPAAQLPPVAVTDTYPVTSQVEMLALVCQKGDVAIRSDINRSFILRVEPATVLANWSELLTPTDTVLSVGGYTGAVTAGNLLDAVKTVDGTGSGLDADTLDSLHASDLALVGHLHTGVYEPAFTKNTGFNKNLGTTAGTVSEGNHAHTFAAITSKPTTLAGYGITDAAPSSHVGATGAAHGDATTSVAGFMSGADKTKLDGVEAGATADQTAAEILTAIKTVDGSGSGLDADLLDGANALTTATANSIAKRDANGYLFGVYFNGNGTFATAGSASGIVNFTGTNGTDTYGRSYSVAAVKLALGLDTAAYTASTAYATAAQGTNADTAYGWGNHASAGYLTALPAHTLDSHSNVTITSNSAGEILKWNGSAWVNNTLAEAGLAAASHTHTAANVTDFNAAALAAAPAETATTVGALISGATAKTTPVDADSVGLSDSAASNVLKKLTWANVKATLKTYFDTLYALAAHTHLYAGSGSAGGSATSAVYSSAVTLTADNTTNATNYPLFVNAATGNLSPRTDTGWTYNPSTGMLTATGFTGALTGNASTATSAATWTTARTLTIGATGKSVNGSAAVSWSLAEIGAAATSHTHSALTAGNGITGTAYNGGTAYTWSIASHAGTAGSIGTINIGADTVGVNLGTTSTTAAAGNHTHTGVYEPADGTILKDADIGVTVQAYDADIPTVAASQAEMEAGTEAAIRSMSPLRVAQAVAAAGGARRGESGDYLLSGLAYVDITGIDSWARVIDVSIYSASPTSTVVLYMQFGDAGGVEITGYTQKSVDNVGAIGVATSNFDLIPSFIAADSSFVTARILFTYSTTPGYSVSWNGYSSSSTRLCYGAGGKACSAGALDRIRIGVTGGTFDSGVVNVFWRD